MPGVLTVKAEKLLNFESNNNFIGNINTEKTLASKIVGGNGVYCSILWSSRGNTDVYGGYIKLEKQ